MFKYIVFFLLFIHQVSAFILIDPNYRLANPEDTVVYIASGGCVADGVSNDLLSEHIEESIDDYWNTVPDSRLYMKLEGETTYTVDDNPPSGAIVIGCGSLPDGIAGGAIRNNSNDGCRIIMRASLFLTNRESAMGTLIHEMGHCVGLGHSDDTASVMTYNATSYVQPAALSRDDKDGVTYLYPYESTAGLLGGCSALAGGTGSEGQSVLDYLVFLLAFVSIFGLKKALGRFSNAKEN